MTKLPLIPEGGVFAIPVSDEHCVYAQVWTVSEDGVVCNCGISDVKGDRRPSSATADWSDKSIYRNEANLIIDTEWLNAGWPLILGFAPAKIPLRDELPWWRRIAYDWFGWRPEINSFVHYEGAQDIARRALKEGPR